jgi:drug/metabolite transporter (DMT)-like permease
MMITAIFCFSLMDVAFKMLAPKIGVPMAVWVRYTGQMICVLILIAPRLRSVIRTRYPVLQLARSVFLLGATCFFVYGLTRVPLPTAAALISTNPILISLGAALFLKEKLGPRRIAAIAVSMCGALLIIRPGGESFTPDAVFPLLAALSYSGYALLTRHAGAAEDVWTSLFYATLFGAGLLTVSLPVFWVTPDLTDIKILIPMILFGTFGHLLLIRAFTIGEASMLAPFSYAGLIFAGLWGVLFFQEWPDLSTFVGALVITASGLYVWHRETRAG